MEHQPGVLVYSLKNWKLHRWYFMTDCELLNSTELQGVHFLFWKHAMVLVTLMWTRPFGQCSCREAEEVKERRLFRERDA